MTTPGAAGGLPAHRSNNPSAPVNRPPRSATATAPDSIAKGIMSTPVCPPRPYHPGLLLSLLAGAQFLVVLNTSIVNVALPAIGQDLDLTPAGLTWTVNAYLIAFGALLPLGGRLTDLLGHRTAFLSGLLIFTTGSLAASIPSSAGPLITARVIQGIGAALLSPAGLAILLAHQPPGPGRGKALGIWGAASAAGGAAGVLLSGALTSSLGWWAIFAISALAALPCLMATPSSSARASASAPHDSTCPAHSPSQPASPSSSTDSAPRTRPRCPISSSRQPA